MQPNLGPRRARSPIAGLSPSVSVYPVSNNKRGRYWRVLLGRKFTGGKSRKQELLEYSRSRKWIFGDAPKLKADPGSLLELKSRAGSTVFELSSAQVNEAIYAFNRLDEVNMTLTEAVDFAIKHSKPDAGVME